MRALCKLGIYYAFWYALYIQPAWSGPAEDAFRSSSLPIYRLDYGNPLDWVNKNSVRALTRAANFGKIQSRLHGKLSSACALGEFNQRRDSRYFVVAKSNIVEAHKQAVGVVVLGYAHGSGINLHDPKGLAQEDQGYLFRYDRTGRCEVFLAT